MKSIIFLNLVVCLSWSAFSSNLANPASPLPKANVLIGASYHLGGYTLTNLEIPAMFNRFHGRVDYAPVTWFSLGVDVGATQIEVDRYISARDTIDLFHGEYGFSGGAHLKLSTPAILKKTLSLFTIGQGTTFSSKNDRGAMYGGYDGCAVVGLQFRIPNFGYISAGPMVYLIEGDAEGSDGRNSTYSNVNNIRGWIAIDYIMKSIELTKGNPYISVEFSCTPDASYSKRIPIQEFSLSVSIGYISGKLYGNNKEPR